MVGYPERHNPCRDGISLHLLVPVQLEPWPPYNGSRNGGSRVNCKWISPEDGKINGSFLPPTTGRKFKMPFASSRMYVSSLSQVKANHWLNSSHRTLTHKIMVALTVNTVGPMSTTLRYSTVWDLETRFTVRTFRMTPPLPTQLPYLWYRHRIRSIVLIYHWKQHFIK